MRAFGRCGWGEGGRQVRRPHRQTPGRWLDVGSALSVQDMHDTVRSRDLLRMHHEQIEAWMLEQAGVASDATEAATSLHAEA